MLGPIFALTLLALAPALLPGAGYAWDDVMLIRDNPLMASETGLAELLTGSLFQTKANVQDDYYRPLVTLSYWLEQRLFDGEPLGHHWVNLLLHLGCITLAYRWLARRVDDAQVPAPVRTLWLGLATLLFAVHPSRPESVAWISGRTDPMALLFGLLAIETFERGGKLRTTTTGLLFVLALLCKETAFLLVPLWLLDAWLLRGDREPSHDAQRARWRVAALVTLALLVRLWRLPPAGHALGSPGGVLAALGEYTRALFAPFPPSAVVAPVPYDATGAPLYSAAAIALGGAVALALLALLVGAIRRPALRPWLADTLWLVVPLLPVLQIVSLPLSGHIALRFLYIPLLGACALSLRAGLRWSRARAPSPRLLLALGALVALLYLPFDVAFARAYRSDLALWQYELAVDRERAAVLDQALLDVPLHEVSLARTLAGEGVRVAQRDGQHWLAMRMALRFGRVYAESLPRDLCPEPLLDALDDLAAGRRARLGDDDPLQLQLPAAEARRMRERHGLFWSLRADLLIRCGRVEEARESLRRAPETVGTAIMSAWAEALGGDFETAQQSLQRAQRRWPLEQRLARAARTARQAAELQAQAERAGPRAPILRARAHLALGDARGARLELDRAGPGLRGDTDYHRTRVELELLAGRPERAKQALAEAREAVPGAQAVWRALEASLASAPSR